MSQPSDLPSSPLSMLSSVSSDSSSATLYGEDLRAAILHAVNDNLEKADLLIKFFAASAVTSLADLALYMQFNEDKDAVIASWADGLISTNRHLGPMAAPMYRAHFAALLKVLPNNKRKGDGAEERSPKGRGTGKSHFPFSSLQDVNPLHEHYWDCLAICAALAACAIPTPKVACICGAPNDAVHSYNYLRHLKDHCSKRVDGAHNNILCAPTAPVMRSAMIPQSALAYFGLLSLSQRQELLNNHLQGAQLAPIRETLRVAFAGLPVAPAVAQQQSAVPPPPAAALAGTVNPQDLLLAVRPDSLAAMMAPNALADSAANFPLDTHENGRR
jgi:hypothetical protein